MMYIRSDIALKCINDLSQTTPGTEYIACKVKIGNSRSTVVDVYRPPSLKRSQWKVELSNLFEMATSRTETFILGDFNCDMLDPDKPQRDRRCCLDLLDIFHLKNLITVSTRVTTTSESLIDLVLTNNKRSLKTWCCGCSNQRSLTDLHLSTDLSFNKSLFQDSEKL